MSRSYKKIPIYKDRNPYMKKLANRKLRRRLNANEECFIGNYKSYKKTFESWDICDYYFMGYSKKKLRRLKKDWRNDDYLKYFKSFKEAERHMITMYISK